MSNTNTNLQTQTSNALHNVIMKAGGNAVHQCSSKSTTKGYMENYKNVSQDIRDQLNAKAEVVQIILTGIDNDIYFTVNACPNACEIKFTSLDGKSLESYYSRFYKIMNELVRNQCDVTNHQVNVQFLLQLQLELQRFVTLVKQSQELKTVSYHKLYDILKQHQNKVNEIRAERLARTANLLALVSQQQLVYHLTRYTNNSSTRSQQAATRNRGKAIVNSSPPTYDQETTMVAEDDEMSKDKEIDKLMALISLSFKKIYKATNNNLRTSSNTSRENQDNTLRINRGTGYDNQRVVNAVGAWENVEQADWRDETNDKPEDQELEAHYMYMAQIQEVTPDAANNSGPIFDVEPLQKVQNNDDNYNVFAIESEHLEQPESVNDTYPVEQDEHNLIIDSLDMSYDREKVDQDDDDLAKERELLTSLIEKLNCEIDHSKNRNKFLEILNKTLVDKLKGEIEDFKTKHKSLESSNNHLKEANNELLKTNKLMSKDLKKFQAKLDTYHDVNYASKVAINCAKAEEDLMSYKMESEKSFNEYTRKINDLNQTTLEMKKELFGHQETISIMSQEKEAQIKFYKTLQTMNILNLNYKMSFVKPEFLKKAQRENPRLEYYYVDHMNAILGVHTTLDEFTNLQCDYVDQVVKCEHLEKEISKSKTMSRSFEALQKHAINLELALQQYLKSQLQDKGIAISELKKLIEKMKGKSVETKFEKSSVIRQPNAFKSQRQSILGVIPTTSVSRPQLKSNNWKIQPWITIVKGKSMNLNAKTSNVNFVCVTCGKCVLNDNQDMCVLHYINGVNSRTKMPMFVPISNREPKRTMNQSVATPLRRTFALESTNQKLRSTIRNLYEHVSKTCSWWYPKFTPSRYKWKPKSPIVNVNTNVSMPLGNESRIANTLEPMTLMCSNLSNNPLYSNSFAAHRDISIHRRLWVPDEKSQASKVYYVKGLNHNLFSIGQFCDADLEVAFWKSTCYIRDLKGNDLLTGSHGTDLYSITFQEISTPNLICLMAKATSS
ncbi:hypothetical protein Tco_0093442 [Tanacetum coccineum]